MLWGLLHQCENYFTNEYQYLKTTKREKTPYRTWSEENRNDQSQPEHLLASDLPYLTLKCCLNSEVFERGNVLTGAKVLWISSTAVLRLPNFGGECVTCDFDVDFDVKPTAFCCLGSVVQVSATKGTRKSFLIKKLHEIYTGIPRTHQQKPNEMCVCVNSDGIEPPVTRELDNPMFSRCGEDTKVQRYNFIN